MREVGRVQETARFTGNHIRVLMKEVDVLKKQMGTKAEAVQVVNEFDKLRGEVKEEFGTLRRDVHQGVSKAMVEADIAGTAAKLATLGDMVNNFGAQVQDAFQHVTAVEASLEQHVS